MSAKTWQPKAYWFQALINRNGVCVQRQGTVEADYAYAATNEVRKLAAEWGVPIMELAIYEINEEGVVGRQLIKTSDSGTKWTGQSHTCEDEVRPYQFGTFFSTKSFPTFTFNEDTKDGKDSVHT